MLHRFVQVKSKFSYKVEIIIGNHGYPPTGISQRRPLFHEKNSMHFQESQKKPALISFFRKEEAFYYQ